MKPACCRRSIVTECDVFHFPTTLFSHLVQQEPINRAADTKRKYSGVGMVSHLCDYSHIVTYVAVSHKTDDAQMTLSVGRIQGSLDGFHHFGSTAAGTRSQKSLGLLQILLGRGHWFRK